MARVVHTLPALIDISEDDEKTAIIDLNGGRIIGIAMSDAWTAAGLWFSASISPAGTFQIITDSAGANLAVSAAADDHIGLKEVIRSVIDCTRYIKVGSGTGATPVAQAADRQLYLMVEHQDHL